MNQKLLLRRDELARSHQLGDLKAQCPSRLFLQFAGWGGIGLLSAIALFLLLLTVGTAVINGASLWLILLLLVVTLGGGVGSIVLTQVVLYLFTYKEVYLYEHGLLCLRGHHLQVARWEQISSVVRQVAKGGSLQAFIVYLQDHTSIKVPRSVERFGELQQVIERHADLWNHPLSGVDRTVHLWQSGE